MIKINFSQLVLIYIVLSLIIIFTLWLFCEKMYFKKKKKKSLEEYFTKCPFCAHAYIDSKNEKITQCPVCENFTNKKNI